MHIIYIFYYKTRHLANTVYIIIQQTIERGVEAIISLNFGSFFWGGEVFVILVAF
jgi:hypothetical protein